MTKKLPYIKPRIWPKLHLRDFYGGLNTREAPSDIANNEAQDILNIDFAEGGAISKRNGTNIVGNDKSNTADTVKGIAASYYGSASAKLLMATQDATTSGLYYRTTGNYTEATLGGAAVKLAAADTEFENFLGTGSVQYTFMTDGTRYQYFKPATNSIEVPGATPATIGGILRVYKNRMYAVGSSAKSERVYFSGGASGGNGETWDVGDYFDVPSQAITSAGATGDPITAMAVLQDRLIIFKARSVWTYDTNTLRQISDAHGCVGKRAIAASDYFLYFADNDGIYRLSGTSISKVSKKIQPTFDGLAAAAIGGTTMEVFQGKLYVSVGDTGTTNNKVLVQHTELPPDEEGQRPWSTWKGTAATPLDINSFAIYEATTTTAPILSFGKEGFSATGQFATTGDADYHFTGGARNESVDGYYKTKDFSLSARFKKLFATVKAQATSINLNIDATVDFATTVETDFDMYSASYDAVVKKANVSEKGKYVNYKLQTSASSAQPFTIYELKQTYKPIKLR